jgi:hypothetical protein
MSKEWEILKEKGNEEFKKKSYNTAINLYSQALGILSLTSYKIKQTSAFNLYK